MWIKSQTLQIKGKIHAEKIECVNISLREQPSVFSCLEEQKEALWSGKYLSLQTSEFFLS